MANTETAKTVDAKVEAVEVTAEPIGIVPKMNEEIKFYTNATYEAFKALEVKGNFTKKGIKPNIFDWLKHKNNLITLLRKHPEWDEKNKAVIHTVEEQRKFEKGDLKEAFDKIMEEIFLYDTDDCGIKHYKYEELRNNLVQIRDVEVTDKKTGELKSKQFNYDLFLQTIIYSVKDYIIDEELANYISARMPELKIRKGAKFSKVINKIFIALGIDKIDNFNKLYAILSDAASPKIFKRLSVLSVNFIDFMLMSNGNSWSSCHAIAKLDGSNYNGCYKAGCAGYGTDNVSLIFYTLTVGTDLTTTWDKPKVTREIFFYENGYLTQERLYPQCNDHTEEGSASVKNNREIVTEILAMCEGVENTWLEANISFRKKNNSTCFMYADWANFSHWDLRLKDITKVKKHEFVIGDLSYCMACGEPKHTSQFTDHAEATLYCGECVVEGDYSYHSVNRSFKNHSGFDYRRDDYDIRNFRVCLDCGRTFNIKSEGAYFDEATQSYFCPSCTRYCAHHKKYEPRKNRHFYYYEKLEGDICEKGLLELKLKFCERCGNIEPIENIEIMKIRNRKVTLCKKCYKIISAN